MGIQKNSKINLLVRSWPKGTVGTASYLNNSGYSYGLLAKYKKGGWIKPFGRGAYTLLNDKVEWPGAVYALQHQLELDIYPGGKTALEMSGYAHYLPVRQTRIYLYGNRKDRLPSWFNQERLALTVMMISTNLFPSKIDGFTIYSYDNFSIKISSAERAAMEMLHLVPKLINFEEAELMMENLVALRPALVEQLLENCRSIKVKRLFLYLAEKLGHPWVSAINLAKIDCGAGKRVIVTGGKLDNKYQITVPTKNNGVYT